MSHRQKCHSQLFNIAGRFVGACFVLGGVIFIIYGVTKGGALYVVPGLVVTVLGILLICARPYRPDLVVPIGLETFTQILTIFLLLSSAANGFMTRAGDFSSKGSTGKLLSDLSASMRIRPCSAMLRRLSKTTTLMEKMSGSQNISPDLRGRVVSPSNQTGRKFPAAVSQD